jgi:hypothetical protein
VRHQIALARIFGFVGQRGQGAFERQASGDQTGKLACPDCERGR